MNQGTTHLNVNFSWLFCYGLTYERRIQKMIEKWIAHFLHFLLLVCTVNVNNVQTVYII